MSTTMLLGDRGKVPFIGPETGKLKTNGISIFQSPHGSIRYVLYVGRLAISALQIVVGPGRPPVVANVFTMPGARGKGHAAMLFEAARLDHPTLEHAEPMNRTDDGDAWVRALSTHRPTRR